MTDVVIIILTLNQLQRTRECLDALFDAGVTEQVLVWDNGSQDSTAEIIRRDYPGVKVHVHPTNLGVASGRNAAAELACQTYGPRYLLFLDNDIVVEPGFVQGLRDAFGCDAPVGQAQAKLRFMHDRARLNDGGGARIDFLRWRITPVGYGELDQGQHDAVRPCISCGGAMMVRADVFQELGGFDTQFDPFGPEDLDFSLRLQKAGYTALYAPQAVGYHAVSHTFGEGYEEAYARHKSRHWFRFMRRHASPLQQVGFFLLGAPYLAVSVVAREGRKGNFGAIRGLFGGLVDVVRGERRFESAGRLGVGRLSAILLAAITILAWMLRLYRLGDWSFWIDEVFTVQGSRFIADWPLLRLPIYLVLTRLSTDLLGTSEWSARLAPTIIGGLTPVALYWPVKRVFNTPTALIAVFLLAISPWHIWWSQNARYFALLVLFYNVGFLLLFLGLENNRARYLVPGLCLLLLAGRERELGFLFMPALAVYVLLLLVLPFERPAWLQPRNLLLLSAPALLFLAYDAVHYSQTGTSWVRSFFLFFAGNPIDSPVRILILILFDIGLPIVALASFSGVWLTSRRSRAGLFLLCAAAVPVLFLIGVSPFTFTVDRYALVTLPAWLILAAVGVERLAAWLPQHGRWLAAATLAILVADAGGALLMYYQLNQGNRPDWRGSFAYLADHMEPADLVVTSRLELGQYYLGEQFEIQDLAAIDPAALESGRRDVWFVVDSEGVWMVPPEKKRWMEANAELLFVDYLRVREQINIQVYRYSP